MADENQGAAAPEPGTAPSMNLVGQYVRDLSFENPGAPGSIMAGGGIVWAVYRATNGLNLNDSPMQSAAGAVLAQRGLIELCGVGVLMWLVGKWRMHTTAHM